MSFIPLFKLAKESGQNNGVILIIYIGIALTVFYLRLDSYRRRRRTPLPPGPRGFPLIGILPYLSFDTHRYFANLSSIYGPILKVPVGNKIWVILSSPEMAKEVLREQDSIFANHEMGSVARVFSYNGMDMVWSPYGPQWKMIRKLCVRELLCNSKLDACSALRRREVRRTVAYVNKLCNKPLNVSDQMFITNLNVMMSMLWGSVLEDEERCSLGTEFRKKVEDVVELNGKLNVSDIFPVLGWFDVQGLERRMKILREWFDSLFDSVMDQRMKLIRGGARSYGKHSRDFLSFLLELKDQNEEQASLTRTHIKALLFDMVVAGTDTTSTTVEWTMAELIQNPEILKKTQEELDGIVGSNNVVEETHLPKLQYLEAVVKEVLRLHPVAPLLLPHYPTKSCQIGGYTIPVGNRVSINVWAIQRNPEFWENPLLFDPERFMNTKTKWDFHGNDFRYFPFGSGRRICAGIAVAERMLIHVLASLLHSFDWSLPEGEKTDMSEKCGIVLKKTVPLVLIPTSRLSDPLLYT